MVGHIKVLAVFHILWSVMWLMTAFVVGAAGLGILGFIFVLGDAEAVGVAIVMFMVLMFAFIYGLMALPGLIGGAALLQGHGWARVPLFISAVLALSSFPYGLALCGYTLVVLLDEDVRRELGAA